MDFEGIELRELERIVEPHIPESIRIFYIDKGMGSSIQAQTTDFTAKGIRLLISSREADFQRLESVIIQSEDSSYRLIGEIRHIVRVHNNTTYIGIKFYNSKSLERFIALMEGEEAKSGV